jgi:hypothetical protein
MDKNAFKWTEQGVSDPDLDEVESSFRFTLPKEVRSHYLSHNGGSPSKCLFIRDGVILVVQQFLPVKYGKHLFEQTFLDLKVDDDILPTHLVPFATDPGGDYYCFSVRDNDMGSIWIYRGEYSEEPDRAVQFIAGSLNEFVEGMEDEDD